MDKTESNSMKQIDHQVWIHTYNLSSREADSLRSALAVQWAPA